MADDQLSLAIGKHGQNVRLASQLVSWELDLFSFDQWKQLQEQAGAEETAQAAEDEKKKATEQQSTDRDLAALTGVGEKILVQLKAAGFDTLEKIVAADVEALVKIKGLGEVKAKKIIKDAKSLLGSSSRGPEVPQGEEPTGKKEEKE